MPIQFSLRYFNDNFDGIVRRMRQRGEPGFGITHRGKDVGYLTLAVDRASQAPATAQPAHVASQLPLPIVPNEDAIDYDALQAQVENDGDLQTQIEAMFADSPLFTCP